MERLHTFTYGRSRNLVGRHTPVDGVCSSYVQDCGASLYVDEYDVGSRRSTGGG